MDALDRVAGGLARGTLRRPFQLGAMIVAVVALALVWPPSLQAAGGPNAFQLLRDRTPPGPAVLASVDSALLWRTDAAPTSVARVQNVTDRGIKCEVWWILAGFGEEDPWNRPAASSKVRLVSIPAGGSAAVKLPAKAASIDAAPGLHSLSFWVHCLGEMTSDWRHSDGATMRGGVEVVTASGLDRIDEAATTLWIDDVSIDPVAAVGGGTRVAVRVANSTSEPTTIDLVGSVTTSEESLPRTDAGAIQTPRFTVPAARLTLMDVAIPPIRDPGEHTLTIRLRRCAAVSCEVVDAVVVKWIVVARG